MTVSKYIEQDLPFYHITSASNKESILKNGLHPMKCKAICTVRSDDKIVWDNIIATQLGDVEKEYVIIKLVPSKHGISVDNVAEDSIDEPTTPLHNYIADIPCIKIEESDIICDNYIAEKSPGPVPDELIENLEDYTRKPIPDDSVLCM
ncbi:MAG: hypothetical protein IKX65_11505 [Prevotella sp.]|nr:hypothetical protein [Prevotella sp.]